MVMEQRLASEEPQTAWDMWSQLSTFSLAFGAKYKRNLIS